MPAEALWRSAIGKMVLTGGAVAERHQEAAAGRGAEAELLAESAMEKRMAALWQRAIGKMLAGRGAAVAEILLARGAAAELLAGSCRKALRHKKRE